MTRLTHAPLITPDLTTMYTRVASPLAEPYQGSHSPPVPEVESMFGPKDDFDDRRGRDPPGPVAAVPFAALSDFLVRVV
jgi:hypothetical protein